MRAIFKSRNTLKDIFNNKNYNSDVLYSGSYVEYPNFKIWSALPLNHLNDKCHLVNPRLLN